MKRKPEWMAMYQELVERHQLKSDGPYADHPYEFRRTVEFDAYGFNELEWCLEHLAMDAWGWRHLGDSDGNGYYDSVVFAFADDADCVLFALTWGNG
jgi:hypothetical protein